MEKHQKKEENRFKVTPGKLEELQERLVEMRGTPAKGGETPEKIGEPKRNLVTEFDISFQREKVLWGKKID